MTLWPISIHDRRLPAIAQRAWPATHTEPAEPLFLADWYQVLMLHYEVEPSALQRAVPFPLDLHDGEAFVTLVAFTMRGMRPRFGGRLGRWLFASIASHPFLNVRTYVRHSGEHGIYFMTEWLPNRISVALGPRFFGLPYRLGQLEYRHPTVRAGSAGIPAGEFALQGRVAELVRGTFAYTGRVTCGTEPGDCEPGSLTEWLMERYTAFTCARVKARFFRVWHPPWKQSDG